MCRSTLSTKRGQERNRKLGSAKLPFCNFLNIKVARWWLLLQTTVNKGVPVEVA